MYHVSVQLDCTTATNHARRYHFTGGTLAANGYEAVAVLVGERDI